MKTINHNGNTYQLGMNYLFRDSADKPPKLGILSNVIRHDKYPFKTEETTWKICEELPPSNEIGTITLTPIELIDGKAYQFTNVEDNTIHGIYSEDEHSFNGTCVEWPVFTCTNIQLLTVEIK